MTDYDRLSSRLPKLPPAVAQRRIEVTETTFVAWDLSETSKVSAVAFLKDNDGKITVWTPGYLESWVWRGPRHIPSESAKHLESWLIHSDDSGATAKTVRIGKHTEVRGKAIWIWDPSPNLEGGLGVLRLANGGFELSFMMAGLRRGGARIGPEDGGTLARWLIDNSGYRPFRRLSGKELIEKGRTAARKGDREAAERRKKSRKVRQELESIVAPLGFEPIPWLEKAAAVTRRYMSKTTGHHNVYIILLSGINNETPGYALYVGITGQTPEERFANHKAGYKSSKSVEEYGECLLPSLYDHLNPMGYAEAQSLEKQIAESLKEAGIPVYGGH
jgi:hypothetical protein